MSAQAHARRVPEVLQTSLMDCGPAALQAVLQGFGVRSDYETLRMRCQTDVDGTSLYELAKLARAYGVGASQVLVPRDTLLLPAAACLPAIAVTSEAAGMLHFVVVWKTLGAFVQVMDPNTGRRWIPRTRLLAALPDLPIAISSARFATWRKTRYAHEPLVQRLRALGMHAADASALVEPARTAPDHRPYATLDAATRMLTTLMDGGAVRRGREALRLHQSVLAESKTAGIPLSFWWITESDRPGMLTVRGAPIIHFERASGGSADAPERDASPRCAARESAPPSMPTSGAADSFAAPLVAHARDEHASLAAVFLRLLRVDLPLAPLWLALVALLSGLVALVDLATLQGVIHVLTTLTLPQQRMGAIAALVALSTGGLALDLGAARAVTALGYRLELRMRGALLQKLPALSDAYVRTRSTADLAQRGHALHLVHQVPETARRALESAATLAISALALALLFPEGALATGIAALSMLGVPWLFDHSAAELVLRARAHMVALDRFYLDALTGVIPIRVHGAERAVRREHEMLLSEWMRTSCAVHAQTTLVRGIQTTVAALLGMLLASSYLEANHAPGGLLLIVFLVFRIPAAGMAYVDSLVSYRSLQPVVLRCLAPLAVPDANPATDDGVQPSPGAAAIALRGVGVSLASRALLRRVDLSIAPGQHVAVVGASGAGKSTLVGLFLGWQAPSEGAVLVDGAPLDASALARLRARTVWIDPSVQIWNDSLIHNVLYGADDDDAAVTRLGAALDDAHLTEVVDSMPEGMAAALGEGGARVSGGQGQRVRIARGLIREAPRLVVLDEPFRGLERPLRAKLLARLRARFADATLLFVSHDVRDTTAFDRVLVIQDGTIVEDGAPADLRAQPESRYQQLLRADEEQHGRCWDAGAWRKLAIHAGQLAEET